VDPFGEDKRAVVHLECPADIDVYDSVSDLRIQTRLMSAKIRKHDASRNEKIESWIKDHEGAMFDCAVCPETQKPCDKEVALIEVRINCTLQSATAWGVITDVSSRDPRYFLGDYICSGWYRVHWHCGFCPSFFERASGQNPRTGPAIKD